MEIIKRAIEDSKLATPEYQDDRVSVYNHLGKIFVKWHGEEEEIHFNYMENKLAEFVGNNYAGSWMVSADEPAMPGMRCFTILKYENILFVEWKK